MSFFTPTPEELEAIKQNEIEYFKQQDFEKDKMAVILESEFKNKHEEQQRAREEEKRYTTRDDLLGGLIDSIGNGLERWFEEIRRKAREAIEAAERAKLIKEIEAQAEHFLKESKSVKDLEARMVEVKKAFEVLDKEMKFRKGDTTEDRLKINKIQDNISKVQEVTKEIKDKAQSIHFENRVQLQSELKRCFEKENTLEVKLSNSELIEKIKSSAEQMKEQSAEATEKIRGIYQTSQDWQKHKVRDPEKYYYKEPAHLFTGSGIPKDSQSGQAITEHLKTRNQMEKGISESEQTLRNLNRIEPEHKHEIKLNKNEDFFEKINHKAQEVIQELKRQEPALEMSR